MSSIDHRLSQILALHQNTAQSSRFPPDETASYQNWQFVEEYQAYNNRNILSLILEYHRTAISVRETIRCSHEILIYRDYNIITYNIATDVRKGHVSSHQFACFVTVKVIPEIYVQLKTKYVIITAKFDTFQRLVVMSKDRNRNTGSTLALSEVTTK